MEISKNNWNESKIFRLNFLKPWIEKQRKFFFCSTNYNWNRIKTQCISPQKFLSGHLFSQKIHANQLLRLFAEWKILFFIQNGNIFFTNSKVNFVANVIIKKFEKNFFKHYAWISREIERCFQMLRLILNLDSRVSCRPIFRKYEIFTLSGLYVHM